MARSKSVAMESTVKGREPGIGKELNVYVDCTANNALFPQLTRVCTYNEDGICSCPSRNVKIKKSIQKIKGKEHGKEDDLIDFGLMLRNIIGKARNNAGEGPMVVAAGQRVVPLELSLESVLRRGRKNITATALSSLVDCTLAKAATIHQEENRRLQLGLEPRSVSLDKVEFIPSKRGRGRSRGKHTQSALSHAPTNSDEPNCPKTSLPEESEELDSVVGMCGRRGNQPRGRASGRSRGGRRGKSQRESRRTKPSVSCAVTQTVNISDDLSVQPSSTPLLAPSLPQLPVDILDGCEPWLSGTQSLSLPVLSPCPGSPSSLLFADPSQNSSCDLHLAGLQPCECMSLPSHVSKEIAVFIPIINLVEDPSSESSIPASSPADLKGLNTLVASAGPEDMKHKSRKRLLKSETPDKERKRNRSTAQAATTGPEPGSITQAQVSDKPSSLLRFETNQVSSNLKQDEPSSEPIKDCKMDEIPTHQKISIQKKSSRKSKKDPVDKEVSRPSTSFPFIKLKEVSKKQDRVVRNGKDKPKIELPENPINDGKISDTDKLGGKNCPAVPNGEPESVISLRDKPSQGCTRKESSREKNKPTFNLICKDRSQEMSDKRKYLKILSEGTSSERTYSFKSNVTVEADNAPDGKKETCAPPRKDQKSTDAKKSKTSSKKSRLGADSGSELKEKSRRVQRSIKKREVPKLNSKGNQPKRDKEMGKTMSRKEKGDNCVVGKSVLCEQQAVSPGSSSGVSSSKSEVSDSEGPAYEPLRPSAKGSPRPDRHPVNQDPPLFPHSLTSEFSKNKGIIKFPSTIGSHSSSYLELNLKVTLGGQERVVTETAKDPPPSADRTPLDEKVVNHSNDEVSCTVVGNVSTTENLETLMSPFLTGFEGASEQLKSLVEKVLDENLNVRGSEENLRHLSPVCNNPQEPSEVFNVSSPEEETLPYSPLGRSPIASQVASETHDSDLPKDGAHLSYSPFECVESPPLSVNGTGELLLTSGPAFPDSLLTQKDDVEGKTTCRWTPDSPMEIEETLSYSPLEGDERLMYSTLNGLAGGSSEPTPHPHTSPFPHTDSHRVFSNNFPSSDHHKEISTPCIKTVIEEKERSPRSVSIAQQETTGEISEATESNLEAITSPETITGQQIERKLVDKKEEKGKNSGVNEQSDEFNWISLDLFDETFYFLPGLEQSLQLYQKLKESNCLELQVPKNEGEKTESQISPIKEELKLEPPTRKIEREPEFHPLFDNYCQVHLKTNNCLSKDCRLSHSVGDGLRGLSGEQLWSLVEKLVSGCSMLCVDVVHAACDALGAVGQRHHLLQLAGRLLAKVLPPDYGRTCLSALISGFHQAQVDRITAAHQILSHLASLSPPPSHQVLEDVVSWLGLDAGHPEDAWRVIQSILSFEGFVVPVRILRHLVGATTRLGVCPSPQFLEGLVCLMEAVPPQRIVELRILPLLQKLRNALVAFRDSNAYLADLRVKKVIESCDSLGAHNNCEVSSLTEKSIQPDKPAECPTDQYGNPPFPHSGAEHQVKPAGQTTSRASSYHHAGRRINGEPVVLPGQSNKDSTDSNSCTNQPAASLAPKAEINVNKHHNWPRNEHAPTVIQTPSFTKLNARPQTFNQSNPQSSQVPTSQTNHGSIMGNTRIQRNNDFNRPQSYKLKEEFDKFLNRVPDLLIMKHTGLIFDGIFELCKEYGTVLLQEGPRKLLSLFRSQDWFLRMKDLFDIFGSFLIKSNCPAPLKNTIRDFIGALGTLKMFDLVEDCSWKSARMVYCMMRNSSFEEIVYLGPGVGEHMSQLKQILFVCEVLFHCEQFLEVSDHLMRYELLNLDPASWKVSMEPQEEVLVRQYLTSFLEVTSKSSSSHSRHIATRIIVYVVRQQKSLTAPIDVRPFCMNIFRLHFTGEDDIDPLKFYGVLRAHDQFFFTRDIYRMLLITAVSFRDFALARELFNLCKSLRIYILPQDLNKDVEIDSYYKFYEVKVYIAECLSQFASLVSDARLTSFSFNIKLKESSYQSGIPYLNQYQNVTDARVRLQRVLDSCNIFYNLFDPVNLLVTLDPPSVQRAIRKCKAELSRQGHQTR